MKSVIIDIKENEKEMLARIDAWLPKTIIDSHVHCWPSNGSQALLNQDATIPGGMFNYFDWDSHHCIQGALFQNKDYISATMGLPSPNAQTTKSMNDHIRAISSQDRNIIPIFLQLKDAPEAMMTEKGKGGFKVYPSREQKRGTMTKIAEIIDNKFLNYLNLFHLPIILHLPQDIIMNLDDLAFTAKRHPNTIFIIAHMGNCYQHDDEYVQAIKEIRKTANVVFDTSMVADPLVITAALECLGSERVIFGSDAPFSYIRGRYCKNDTGQIRLQSQIPYGWVKKDEYSAYKKEVQNFRLIHLEIIDSTREAILMLKSTAFPEKIKEKIFFENSKNIFKGGYRHE